MAVNKIPVHFWDEEFGNSLIPNQNTGPDTGSDNQDEVFEFVLGSSGCVESGVFPAWDFKPLP